MIQLRCASPSDAPALTDLARTTFIETFAKDNSQEDMDLYVAETFNVDKQRQEIIDPQRWIELAWSEGQPVGFLHLLMGAPDPCVLGPKPIEILRLYVASVWHGKGVAAALMDRCLEISREQGYQTIWLGVWEQNFRAQAFYRKYGFSVIGSHIFRLGSDEQSDFIMCRSL